MKSQAPAYAGTDATEPSPAAALPGGHPMEIWISYVLRTGVMVAGAIILVGLVLFVLLGSRGGSAPTSLEAMLRGGGQAIQVSPGSIVQGLARLEPLAIIQLGVLVLILTPMMRVAMTVLLFLAQRDWIFVAITCVVLTVLILGLIGVGS